MFNINNRQMECVENNQQIILSPGVTIVNEVRFLEVYESRKEAVSILSDGVKERMILYNTIINDNDTIN